MLPSNSQKRWMDLLLVTGVATALRIVQYPNKLRKKALATNPMGQKWSNHS